MTAASVLVVPAHDVKQPGRVGKGARSRAPCPRVGGCPSRVVRSARPIALRVDACGTASQACACPPYEFIRSRYSHSRLPFFATRYSLISIRPLARGGRSAGGARMRARHPSRRVMTDTQTPLDLRKPGRPALRSWRTTGEPGVRSICANRENPACVRRLAFPATGTLALRRSTWDFWPGPVHAVVRHSLRDRAPTSFDARVIVDPEEQVSRASPAQLLAAPGTPQPRSALQDASRRRPSGARMGTYTTAAKRSRQRSALCSRYLMRDAERPRGRRP